MKIKVILIQNATYTDEFLNGKCHEKGILIWDDGTKYKGIWENDKSNGYYIYFIRIYLINIFYF